MKHNISAEWELNNICNFNCSYCFNPFRKLKKISDYSKNPDKLIKSFDKTKMTWTISFSGGEPFLYPNFVNLCKKLTKKHFIIINTNLSINNVYDFCEDINPKKVKLILCSLHIFERRRLNLVEDFIKKINILKKAEFNVHVSQVMWPPILRKLDNTFNHFKDK